VPELVVQQVLPQVVQQVLPQVQRQLVLVLRRKLQVQQMLLALQQEPEWQLVPLFERVLQTLQVQQQVQHFVRALQVQLLNSELLQIVQTLELGEFHPLVRQLQVSLLLSPLVSLLVNMS
jgi:hypothetical protein